MFLISSLGSHPDKLGDEEYGVRERAERNQTPLSALLLPDDHPDPEIRERIIRIKRKQLDQSTPRWLELQILKNQPVLWIDRYLVNGESYVWSKRELFDQMRKAYLRTRADGSPQPNCQYYGVDDEMWQWAWIHHWFRNNYTWTLDSSECHLWGPICPGEYERWLRQIRLYDRRESPKLAVIGGFWLAIP